MPLAPETDQPDTASAGSATHVPQTDHASLVALAFCWADTVIEIDRDLRITHASGLTLAITGRAPDQMAGQPLDDMLAANHRTELRSLLAIARDCGRVDNVTVNFATPDGGEVPVTLSVHVLPEHLHRAFLAINLATLQGEGPAGNTGGATGLLDEAAFTATARRHLSRPGGEDGRVLTLLAIPEMIGLRRDLDQRTYRNLTNTIAGYLSGRSVDRRAAGLGDGRYGLVHNRALDVARLETQVLSMVSGFAGQASGADIESASIMANEAVSEDTMGQVVTHAVRRFREADDAGAALRQLRDDLPAVAAEAAQMSETFKELVESAGFHIAFQPVVAIDGGTILFFESLARIDDRPDESPYRYISYAEETGQICRFDLAMVEKALRWTQERQRTDIRLSVNISGVSLLNPDCITRLHQIFDADPENAKLLAMEITECFRIPDLDAVDQLIQSLRPRVHMVGLDDFSAGMDGFRMLTALDVDFVKFRAQASLADAESVKARALLEALTGFCRQTGVRTIATAVETVQCLALMRGCGVEFVQGYLLGKPSPEIGSFR